MKRVRVDHQLQLWIRLAEMGGRRGGMEGPAEEKAVVAGKRWGLGHQRTPSSTTNHDGHGSTAEIDWSLTPGTQVSARAARGALSER